MLHTNDVYLPLTPSCCGIALEHLANSAEPGVQRVHLVSAAAAQFNECAQLALLRLFPVAGQPLLYENLATLSAIDCEYGILRAVVFAVDLGQIEAATELLRQILRHKVRAGLRELAVVYLSRILLYCRPRSLPSVCSEFVEVFIISQSSFARGRYILKNG